MKHLPDLLTLRHSHPLFRSSVYSSIRLLIFMLKFGINVKVSILINYKTKQPTTLTWNISLTWLCDISVRFSVRPSVCQHLCRSSYSNQLKTKQLFMSKFDIYVKVSILINYKTWTTIKPCMKHLPDLLTLRHRHPLFRSSVRSSVRQQLCRSTTFESNLINYKIKQSPNLAWNISLTWLRHRHPLFRSSVCSSVRLVNMYVKVRHLRQSLYSNQLQD